MHVLTELDEHDGRARVLAQRDHLALCNIEVLDQLDEHLLSQRRSLRGLCLSQAGANVFGQDVRRFYAQLVQFRADGIDVNLSHGVTSVRQTSLGGKWASTASFARGQV